MSTTSLCARDASKSCDRSARDPIWDLVGQYRRICRDKLALQAALLRELDACEREAELDVERARGALAGLPTGPEYHHHHRGGGASCVYGGFVEGERPAVTDLDGPRDDPVPVREGEGGGRGGAAQGLDSASLPSCTRMGSLDPATTTTVASPSSCAPTCPAASAPDAESSSSRVPADGAIFDKYDRMIAALRRRSPPLTLSFLPPEEIPWPVLPLPSASDGSDGDGTFPVALGGKRPIDVDGLAAFAAGYARWRDKPLGNTLNILLGHWSAMDKRLKEHGPPPDARSEAARTRRAIRDVCGKLVIVAEQGMCAVTSYCCSPFTY